MKVLDEEVNDKNKRKSTNNSQSLKKSNLTKIKLPETLNNRVVGSTESSDYVTGVFKQTSKNDITPYYYPNFYYYSTALKSTNQQQENQFIQQQGDSSSAVLSSPAILSAAVQSSLISNLVNNLNERPKLMHSISIDTTASDLILENNNNKNLYKKKVGELEKKKSKLSLRSIAIPMRRMFSVDARKQFNCKGVCVCLKIKKKMNLNN